MEEIQNFLLRQAAMFINSNDQFTSVSKESYFKIHSCISWHFFFPRAESENAVKGTVITIPVL